MEQIHELKKQGLSSSEIIAKLETKITIAGLGKRYDKWCKENQVEPIRQKAGRKSILIKIKGGK